MLLLQSYLIAQISCRPIWAYREERQSPPSDGRNVQVFVVILNMPQALFCTAWHGLRARVPGFESRFLAVHPWASYLISLCLFSHLQKRDKIYHLPHQTVVRIQ